MEQPGTYYRHSGRIGPLAVPLLLLVGIPGSIILAWLYIKLYHWIPFIYLRIIFALGQGFGVGLLAGMISMFGNVRNFTFTVLFGLILGMISLHAAWVFWTFHDILEVNPSAEPKFWAIASNPELVWTWMKFRAAVGAWSFRDTTPTGWALYLIWIIEALFILLPSVLMGIGMVSDTPFCEASGDWMSEKETIEPLEPIAQPELVKTEAERGRFDSLLGLEGIVSTGSGTFTRVVLHRSPDESLPDEEKLFTLRVVLVQRSVDKDGNQQENEQKVVKDLVIDGETYNALLALRDKEPASPDSAAETSLEGA